MGLSVRWPLKTMRLVPDYSSAYEAAPRQWNPQDGPIQPLDASLLTSHAIPFWLERFRWPVADADFDAFSRDFAERYCATVAALPEAASALLFADIGFVGFLMQHVHIAAAEAAFRTARDVAVAGDVVRGYLSPDWTRLSLPSVAAPSGAASARLAARAAAKGWLLNGHAGGWARAAAAVGRADVTVVGSFSPLMATLLANDRAAARYLYAESHLSGAVAPDGCDAQCLDAIDALLSAVADSAGARFDVRLDFDAARACWRRRLSALAAARESLRRCLDRSRRLFVSNLGNPLHRVLASIWRDDAREVIGFHHGNTMGEQPSFMSGLVEFGVCDTFVVPTATCARWMHEVYKGGPRPREVRFRSVESDTYRRLRQSLTAPAPVPVQTVMVVGFALSWIRYAGHAAHYSLIQLDLEMRLVATLRRNGYRVLLKVHPEWRALAARLWQEHADEVLVDPLETCWQRADAFVFPRSTSSTFGFCLCTNRPIVLINPSEQEWNPEAFALLSRRCAIVPAHVDHSNRVRFDEARLLDSLTELPIEIDYTYVEQVMYPQSNG